MKKIVISPFSLHQDILNVYRKDNDFNDVKLLSKEKIIYSLFGKIDELAIPYLMDKLSLSYIEINKRLESINFINEDSEQYKIKHLLDIKKDLLDNGFIKKEAYFKELFKNKEVEVIGYSKYDEELNYCFKLLNVNPVYISLNKKDNASLEVLESSSLEKEVLYALNNIASLLDQGEDINNIYLYINDNVYLYYLNHFQKDFGFEIALPIVDTLIKQNIVKEIINKIDKNFALDKIDDLFMDLEDNEILNSLKEIINSCFSLPYPFEIKKEYLINLLTKTKVPYVRKKNVIRVIASPIYKSGAHIFILGFKQNSFPHSYKEVDYLNNQLKQLNHLNTTKQLNKIEVDLLKQFLNSDNHFYISYSLKDLNNNYYPSPLIKALNIRIKKVNFTDIQYSIKAINYLYYAYKDSAYLYRDYNSDFLSLEKITDLPYFTYDNKYTNVKAYQSNSYLSHSYSMIKNYEQCPFSYYLKKVLEIGEYEDSFYTILGKIAHSIFDEQKDISEFDKLWEKEIKKYELNSKDLMFLDKLKEDIKVASNFIFDQEKSMHNPIFYREINFKDCYINENSKLTGTIDKLAVIDNKYLVIIDYKTNKESFNPQELDYGYSMQLPTYILLAHSDARFKDLPVIGLFINAILDSSLNKSKEEDGKDYLKLKGKADIDKLNEIDSSYMENGKSNFIHGISILKNGELRKSNTLSSNEEMKEYEEKTKSLYLEADKNIRNNDFPIAPKYISSTNQACMYCEYKDICYRRNDQYINVKEESSEDEIL